MKNLKKVGLSALAGSLAAFSANAVEVSVSGKTEVTYSGTTDGNNGNKFGGGNALTFSGSGEMDNGMTALHCCYPRRWSSKLKHSETFASASIMVDMGDMGTLVSTKVLESLV